MLLPYPPLRFPGPHFQGLAALCGGRAAQSVSTGDVRVSEAKSKGRAFHCTCFYRQGSNTLSTYTHLFSTTPRAGPASPHGCSLRPPHPHHQRARAMRPPVTALRLHTWFPCQAFPSDPPSNTRRKEDAPHPPPSLSFTEMWRVCGHKIRTHPFQAKTQYVLKTINYLEN